MTWHRVRIPHLRLWYLAGLGLLGIGPGMLRGALIRRYGRPARAAAPTDRTLTDAIDVTIPSGGGAVLRGWLREPNVTDEAGEPGPAALVIHGWGASAYDLLPLSEPLVEAGLRVLLLDARGHGRSDDVALASMPTFAADVRTALAWLRERPGIDPDRIVLVGHSVGAGAALFVAADDHAVAAVVSLASMAAPREFMAAQMRGGVPAPLIPLALRYVERVIGHRFTEFSPIHTIGRSVAPILLVHGTDDATVPVTDAQRLHAQVPDRSTLLLLPATDHAGLEAIQENKPALLRFLRDAGVIDSAAPDPTGGAAPGDSSGSGWRPQ